MRAVLLALFALPSVAATTVTPGDWSLYRGTSIVSRHQTEAACIAAADALRVARTYTCRTQTTVAVTVAPPVNCVVSAWSDWSYTAWVVNGAVETRTGMRTRTVVTPASGGGTACPALSEISAESRPYVPSVVWAVAANEGGTFQLYASASVRYGSGALWSATQQLAAGSVQCENWVFGDPAPGVAKRCEVSPASALQSGAPPPPPPPPPPVIGSASLTWLAGDPAATNYRVEYGRGDFATQVPVSGKAYNVTGLASGSYQFRVVEIVGAIETPSNVVTKVIP